MTTPTRLLALDVGTGTTDLLVFEPDRRPENSEKLVVPSRTQIVAGRIRAATRRGLPVVFWGPTMGGGPSTKAMLGHLAAGLAFAATETAALSFADSLDKVAARGVRLIADDEARQILRAGAAEVQSGDVDLDGLLRALAGLGVPTRFSGGCLAAQDHGFSPIGSNRVYRFAIWERALAARTPLEELFYAAAEVPPELTRLRAAAAELAALPQVTAADTGPAALLGALGDELTDAVLVNVGNGHTICAVALEGRLAGIYEDHTNRLDAASLESNVRRFLAGELPAGLPVLVTGPYREMLAGSSLAVRFPAPFGDMMMTGPAGLIRAHRHRYSI
ncbi:MAG: DUF1786 family protein [Thermoleophilia bacterium]